MGLKKQDFVLDFDQPGVEYKCNAKITKRTGKLKVNCKAASEERMMYRCEAARSSQTTFGKVKMTGKDCTLESFTLNKSLTPTDPGFIVEDGKYYFDQNDFEAVANRIEAAIGKETFAFKE